MMPKMTAPVVSPSRIRRTFGQCSHSATAGANSTNWQIMYSRKCHATRKSTEPSPKELPMIGLMTFHGRPRSSSSAPA